MVEPPFAFLEERIEVFARDTVDVVSLVSKPIDRHMVKIGDVEHVIALVAIGVDNTIWTIWLDLKGNYGDKCVRSDIRHGQCKHLSATLYATLYSAKDSNLPAGPLPYLPFLALPIE